MDAVANLEVVAAQIADKPVVARLVQLYLHDFSEFTDVGSPFGDVNASGLFEMKSFDTYWQERGRGAHLFRAGGQLAGFALVNQWSPSGKPVDHSMGEFFVMRKYRRSGVGTRAAHELVRRDPGIWEINVADYNMPALEFWRRAAADVPGYATQRLQGDGVRWSGPIYRLIPAVGAG